MKECLATVFYPSLQGAYSAPQTPSCDREGQETDSREGTWEKREERPSRTTNSWIHHCVPCFIPTKNICVCHDRQEK